jgi:hypothetical protein
MGLALTQRESARSPQLAKEILVMVLRGRLKCIYLNNRDCGAAAIHFSPRNEKLTR